MTHKLIQADTARALYPAGSLDSRATGGAADNRARRPSQRRSVRPASAMAHLSLLLIILLIQAHSGYWALLLPSWLAFVAFLSGASEPAGYDDGMAGALRGGL